MQKYDPEHFRRMGNARKGMVVELDIPASIVCTHCQQVFKTNKSGELTAYRAGRTVYCEDCREIGEAARKSKIRIRNTELTRNRRRAQRGEGRS